MKFLSLDYNAVAFPNTNQPSLSDSSATFIVQNNMKPWNNLLMQDCNNTQDRYPPQISVQQNHKT